MALTLTSGITADADEFVVTGAVPANVGPDFRFRIDDELLRLQGFGAHTEIVGAYARQWAGKDPQRWLVERGVEHSTPASHAQGADVLAANDVFASSDDLTPPSPFSGSPGGSGIPQGGPLTEPLDVSDQALTSAASGANTGAAVTVAAATVDGGGTVEAQAGEHPDGGAGAYMGLFGGEDGGGGTGQFQGGNAIAGAAGGSFTFQAGSGDDGNDAGAKVVVEGGDGEGAAGVVRVTANAVEFNITGPLVHQGGPLTDDLDADGSKIVNLGPTEDPNDAATKAYVDNRTVRFAEGVPSGEPTGTELPIAFDSTAVTGGVYYWTGLAWIKGGTI